MEDTRRYFECDECEAEYNLQTDMDIEPKFCPFCSEPADEIDWEDDENEFGESEGT